MPVVVNLRTKLDGAGAEDFLAQRAGQLDVGDAVEQSFIERRVQEPLLDKEPFVFYFILGERKGEPHKMFAILPDAVAILFWHVSLLCVFCVWRHLYYNRRKEELQLVITLLPDQKTPGSPPGVSVMII